MLYDGRGTLEKEGTKPTVPEEAYLIFGQHPKEKERRKEREKGRRKRNNSAFLTQEGKLANRFLW